MENTFNEFINKLLDDIHNINPELSLKRQTEYNKNFVNKVLNEAINFTDSSTQLKEKEILSFDEWKLIKFSYNNGLYNDLENPRRFYTQNKIYKKYQKEVLNL